MLTCVMSSDSSVNKLARLENGRFYQIALLNLGNLAALFCYIREQQRERRLLEREQQLEVEAKRFQNLTSGEMQVKIEAEIKENKHSDAPALVFFWLSGGLSSLPTWDNKQWLGQKLDASSPSLNLRVVD